MAWLDFFNIMTINVCVTADAVINSRNENRKLFFFLAR